MDIKEMRRILRKYKLTLRKRDARYFHSMTSDLDCPYEVNYQREWRFNINPKEYICAEQVKSKVNYELREEYSHPYG